MNETDKYLLNEKERLLKKYQCNTVEELLQKLQRLLDIKQNF
jgi:hypothetical protein